MNDGYIPVFLMNFSETSCLTPTEWWFSGKTLEPVGEGSSCDALGYLRDVVKFTLSLMLTFFLTSFTYSTSRKLGSQKQRGYSLPNVSFRLRCGDFASSTRSNILAILVAEERAHGRWCFRTNAKRRAWNHHGGCVWKMPHKMCFQIQVKDLWLRVQSGSFTMAGSTNKLAWKGNILVAMIFSMQVYIYCKLFKQEQAPMEVLSRCFKH